ncbi:MAG: hypothetical protein F7B60_03315 [Desulfurococcales archaeon]|nr:hypothetical protein [Desulfurococcales archaeon]
MDPTNIYLDNWLHLIKIAQSPGGGFFTDYNVTNGQIVFGSGVNVETTSLVVIALAFTPPTNITR